MKIITNNYLKRITLNPQEILYYNSIESPDLIEIDNELEKKTIEAAFKFFALVHDKNINS